MQITERDSLSLWAGGSKWPDCQSASSGVRRHSEAAQGVAGYAWLHVLISRRPTNGDGCLRDATYHDYSWRADISSHSFRPAASAAAEINFLTNWERIIKFQKGPAALKAAGSAFVSRFR